MVDLLDSEIKKSYKKEIWIIVSLIFILFLLNYSWIDSLLIEFLSDEEYLSKEKECFVERVIDGDTIIACGNSTRLLGINTPEKKDKFYSEAKKYLEERVLNKTVKIVFSNERTDLYGRTLAYVFLDKSNINQELIKNGFANAYFPSKKDKYLIPFLDSWKKCLIKNKNLCEESKNICSNCILLEELDFIEEKIVLRNNCNRDCNLTDWTIKDEGRKVFVFPNFNLEKYQEIKIVLEETENKNNSLIWKTKDYVWTDSGDTLFLRDNEGKLVLWKNYF